VSQPSHKQNAKRTTNPCGRERINFASARRAGEVGEVAEFAE